MWGTDPGRSGAGRGLLALVAALGACTTPTPADTGPTGDTATTPNGPAPTELVLTDTNNYAYTGTLDVPTLPTAEAVDLHFDWSALTSDMLCHPLDPVADIDNLSMLYFPNLSEPEIEAGMQANALVQVDLGAYVSRPVGDETDAHLSEFTFFGTDVDAEQQYRDTTGSYLLLLTSGTTIGVGTRTLTFLDPDPAATEVEVPITNHCDIVDFDADLVSATPVRARTEGPWHLDWSALTRDGQGNPIDLGTVDSVMLGRYAGTTAEALQADFLDFELLATETWSLSVPSGSTADLAGLTTPDGTPFVDLSAEGLWYLALRCSLCPNPAPLFLTELRPE